MIWWSEMEDCCDHFDGTGRGEIDVFHAIRKGRFWRLTLREMAILNIDSKIESVLLELNGNFACFFTRTWFVNGDLFTGMISFQQYLGYHHPFKAAFEGACQYVRYISWPTRSRLVAGHPPGVFKAFLKNTNMQLTFWVRPSVKTVVINHPIAMGGVFHRTVAVMWDRNPVLVTASWVCLNIHIYHFYTSRKCGKREDSPLDLEVSYFQTIPNNQNVHRLITLSVDCWNGSVGIHLFALPWLVSFACFVLE